MTIVSDAIFLYSDQEATKSCRLASALLSKLMSGDNGIGANVKHEYNDKFNKLDSLSLLSPMVVGADTLDGRFEHTVDSLGTFLIGKLAGIEGNVATFEGGDSFYCAIHCR